MSLMGALAKVVFIISATVGAWAHTIREPNFEISKLDRTIELSGSLVVTKISISGINVGEDTANHFILPISNDIATHIGSFSASSGDVDIHSGNDDLTYYNITLSNPVPRGSKFALNVTYLEGNSLVAFPSTHAVLPSGTAGSPKYLYSTRAKQSSIYPIKSESGTVRLVGSSSSVAPIVVAKQLVEPQVSGGHVLMKFITPSTPNSVTSNDSITFHFSHASAMMRFPRVERNIDLSLWGSVSFHEKFEAINDAPIPEGEFSRTELFQQQRAMGEQPQLSERFHTLFSIDADLPINVFNLEVFDRIGNISTSTARRGPTSTEFHFSPRYPFLGGTKGDWDISYSTPTNLVLSNIGNNKDKYFFELPLTHAFKNVYTNELEVSISLPPGSKNIQVQLPRPRSLENDLTTLRVDESFKWGWLDVIRPRPVIKIKSNGGVVVPSKKYTGETVKIVFEIDTTFELLRPVITLVSYFGIFILMVIVFARMKPNFASSSAKEEGVSSVELKARHDQRFISRAAAASELTNLVHAADALLKSLSKTNAKNLATVQDAPAYIIFKKEVDNLAAKVHKSMKRGSAFDHVEVLALVEVFKCYAEKLAYSALILSKEENVNSGKGNKSGHSDLCSVLTGQSYAIAPESINNDMSPAVVEADCLEAFGVTYSAAMRQFFIEDERISKDPGSSAVGSIVEEASPKNPQVGTDRHFSGKGAKKDEDEIKSTTVKERKKKK